MVLEDPLRIPLKRQSQSSLLGGREKFLLVIISILLALVLFTLRRGFQTENPLDILARSSLDLEVALSNGRPTLVEFYADWCAVCHKMAPALKEIKENRENQINVVLLNVDNPRWQHELEDYGVNSIPQIELFNANGLPIGRSMGERNASEMQAIIRSLSTNSKLPNFASMGSISQLPRNE
uniref:Thioredoxin-like protein TxlA n=1 Tax=Paulinella chromatophora TaxID=39717 RepID=B1X4U1_PAUCH|nr:thioredoxin-like protein TxlA [Paulinella chromatophora]ACB42960.1 thioredoxin-like protein TxlA [Paulinella chromatophora]